MKNLIIFCTLAWVALITIPMTNVRSGEVAMKLESSSFQDGGKIPLKYVMPGAGGKNISPELHWENIPEGTKSLAILMEDPHPVAKHWVHWAVINIPPSVRSIPEGASPDKMPKGSLELQNSFGFKGYGGPQPPPGTGDHPYVFTLYALDVPEISVPEKVTVQSFEKALNGHVLAKAQLTGYFGR